MKYIIVFLLFTSCATQKKIVFSVETEPVEAIIEVNDVVVCESTPCDFWLSCGQRWVGVLNSTSGYGSNSGLYRVTASPNGFTEFNSKSKNKLYTATKIINPCGVEEKGKLKFNLYLEPTNPTQKIEIAR